MFAGSPQVEEEEPTSIGIIIHDATSKQTISFYIWTSSN